MNKKIYALAAVFALAFTITSCEEDDEQDYVTPDVLSGRWVLDQVGMINSAGAVNYVDASDDCAEDEITFQNSGFTSADSNVNVDGNCETVNQEGTWELVDGNLEFTVGDQEFSRDVLSLTPQTMVLVQSNADGDLEFLKYVKSSGL